MARVLIVTSEFEPFISSGINRLSFFKRFLEQQGHFVAVLTTNASAQGVCSDKAYDVENNIHRASTLSKLARRLLSSKRLPIYPKLSRTGKYDVWLPFAVKKGKKLVHKLNIDVVFTSFPDFASLCAAQRIAKLTSTKLISDFRDPPYWIYDQASVNKNIGFCKNIVEETIHQSSQVIVCTQDSKSSLNLYYDIVSPIEIIANGYDAEVISALPEFIPRKDEYFEIVHIGSFYDEGRDIKPIVSALEKHAVNINKKIKLRLIGDVPNNHTIAIIRDIAKSITVSIEPPVKMQEALAIAKQADVLLLLQGERFDRQIPAKVYEYLALNRPIWAVVGNKGETRKLLENYSANVVFSTYSKPAEINDGASNIFNINATTEEVIALSRQSQANKLSILIQKTI
ncbi:MAG: glycosyltransferase [Colwellia sp.]|nr:glycosyltransferase [Colwellia sp.]